MNSPESFFAALYCDYLKAAIGITTESAIAFNTIIPTGLMKRTLDEGLVATSHPRPRLVVKCEKDESSHSRMLTLSVMFDLMTTVPVPNEDGSLGEGTTMSDAQSWMQAVTEYLKDAVAWRTFILTLPEERRTGWRIMKYWFAAPERNDDGPERSRDYRQPLKLRVAVM